MVSLPVTCKFCGKSRHDYGRCPCLPSVLTIRYGNETVVVDPADETEKFAASQKRADELLELLKTHQTEFSISRTNMFKDWKWWEIMGFVGIVGLIISQIALIVLQVQY